MLGNKPLLILTQGVTNDTERINKQKELLSLSHNSKQIVDKKSGHHMQLEDPDLLVTIMKEVIDAIKEHKNLAR